jgi:TPR repeat protein
VKYNRAIAIALSAFLAIAAPTSRAGTAAAATAASDFDADAAWRRFLEDAKLAPTYGAYAALPAVGYGDGGVDPARCTEAAGMLDHALEQVPVSIALRHAALLCAEARGDHATADREASALAALSSRALASAPFSGHAPPILVIAPVDARALVLLSGLKPLYAYYRALSVRRYLPIVIAGLDEASGTERHLAFDFIDIGSRIDRDDPYAGYPVNRQMLADAMLAQQEKGGDQPGADLQAVLAAADLSDPGEKVAKLRMAASGGGILSMDAWIGICAGRPYKGCADGLVDALLPFAEKRWAMSMAQLAYAYDQGIGIAVDHAAADALLAAADRRWPAKGASVQFAQQWDALHDGRFPRRILDLLEAAEAAGSVDATMLRTGNLLATAKGKPLLGKEDIARLASPAFNALGAGEQQLAYYYSMREEKGEKEAWTTRAAEHGDPDAQADEAYWLRYGPPGRRDADRGLRMLKEAAQGGNAYAGLVLSWISRDARDWKAAEAWLLDGVRQNDPGAIMELASLYEADHPGLAGKPAVAVDTYKAVAASGDREYAPQARRRLAAMALAGQGMDKDPEVARAWLLEDAKSGDVESQAMLGRGLLEGKFGDVDEAGGRQWLERAAKAGSTSAPFQLGWWLFHTKATAEAKQEALALWRSASDAGSSYARNSLAWSLCTAPSAAIADRAGGAKVAAGLGGPDAQAHELDTLAACRAAVGDFAQAIDFQEKAITAAGDPGDDAEAAATLKDYRERLALYRAGKPYVAEVDE